jgi:hypothetical protein
LAGRIASLAVQEADIPCSSLLTSDHRKGESPADARWSGASLGSRRAAAFASGRSMYEIMQDVVERRVRFDE